MSVLVGLLVLVAVTASRPVVLRSLAGAEEAAGTATEDRPVLVRLRWPLSALAGLAGWWLVGGVPGLALGAGAGWFAWRTLSAAEPPAAARRRRELERDLPMAVHLLAASLAAGAAPVAAVRDVADALPGAVAEDLHRAHLRLALGVDPATVWSGVDGALRPLGRALARAHESGSSVVVAVERLADDLRAESGARRLAAARTVEVRAAAPLGLCFLPAFLLLGVIPMVAGLLSVLRPFG